MKRASLLALLVALSPCVTRAQRSAVATRAQPVRIDLYAFEFQEPYFGREGPGYVPTKREPAKRAQQFANARLSGQGGISTVKFEAIDAGGNSLKILYLFKVTDGLDDDEYAGFVDVPEQPFRVMVSGRDVSGAAYKRVFDHLFRPQDELPTPAALMSKLVRDQESRDKAEFAAKRRANPDGVIVLPSMQVSNVMHEPYRSESGNTLGIRLSYDVQFSRAASYAMTPSVAPFFEDVALRGSVSMKVAGETLDPEPDFGQQQYAPGFHGLILPAQYKSGVVYHFVVDMVPDYVIQNAAKTKYCINNRKFQGSSRAAAGWETVRTQDVPVSYLVSIRSVNFHGEIPGLYSQKTFYEGFLRVGCARLRSQPRFQLLSGAAEMERARLVRVDGREQMSSILIRFDDGAAYERYMGVWSRRVGEPFLDWLAPRPGLRWLDVGCGNGAFTELIVERCAPAAVRGIDPSAEQLDFARRKPGLHDAEFTLGDAMALPFAARQFDVAVMPLVIFFVPDPLQGVREMVRVACAGGLAAAYAWDMPGGGFPYYALQSEMRAMGIAVPSPPSPEASRPEVMHGIWSRAGLEGVEIREIAVERTFASFDDYWTTVQGGPSVAGLLRTMSAEDTVRLKIRMRERLPTDPMGRVTYSARAYAVKGRVPAT